MSTTREESGRRMIDGYNEKASEVLFRESEEEAAELTAIQKHEALKKQQDWDHTGDWGLKIFIAFLFGVAVAILLLGTCDTGPSFDGYVGAAPTKELEP